LGRIEIWSTGCNCNRLDILRYYFTVAGSEQLPMKNSEADQYRYVAIMQKEKQDCVGNVLPDMPLVLRKYRQLSEICDCGHPCNFHYQPGELRLIPSSVCKWVGCTCQMFTIPTFDKQLIIDTTPDGRFIRARLGTSTRLYSPDALASWDRDAVESIRKELNSYGLVHTNISKSAVT
jgi:hypothetical protein